MKLLTDERKYTAAILLNNIGRLRIQLFWVFYLFFVFFEYNTQIKLHSLHT